MNRATQPKWVVKSLIKTSNLHAQKDPTVTREVKATGPFRKRSRLKADPSKVSHDAVVRSVVYVALEADDELVAAQVWG